MSTYNLSLVKSSFANIGCLSLWLMVLGTRRFLADNVRGLAFLNLFFRWSIWIRALFNCFGHCFTLHPVFTWGKNQLPLNLFSVSLLFLCCMYMVVLHVIEKSAFCCFVCIPKHVGMRKSTCIYCCLPDLCWNDARKSFLWRAWNSTTYNQGCTRCIVYLWDCSVLRDHQYAAYLSSEILSKFPLQVVSTSNFYVTDYYYRCFSTVRHVFFRQLRRTL